jgi:hypothetical protein
MVVRKSPFSTSSRGGWLKLLSVFGVLGQYSVTCQYVTVLMVQTCGITQGRARFGTAEGGSVEDRD